MTVLRRELFGYAQLACALAFAGLPLYLLVPDFYAIENSVPLASISVVLLAVRFLDAGIDPLMGRLLDRWRAHAAPITGFLTLILAASFAALFHPPVSGTLVWFAGFLFLATLSFSTLGILLNSLGSLRYTEVGERRRMTAWRESLGVVGLVLALVLPVGFESKGLYAFFVAGLMGCAGGLFVQWIRRYFFNPPLVVSRASLLDTPATQSSTQFSETTAAWTFQSVVMRRLDPAISRFFAVYFLSFLASTIPAVLVIFFVRDYLQQEAFLGLFLGLYGVSALLGVFLWRRLAAMLGESRAWMLSMLLSAAGLALVFVCDVESAWAYSLVCVITGLGFGGELFFAPILLSRLIDDRAGRQHTGIYFGFYTFFNKLALALGSAFAFWMLDRTGFQPGLLGVDHNTPEILANLVLLYAVVPVVIKCGAVLLLVWPGCFFDRSVSE